MTRRRIERAQDLLRHANLTVTEICMAVGFASLGSFSSRFRELVGESPSAYRDRWAARGGAHVPGCFLFMRGVLDLGGTSGRRIEQSERSPAGGAGSTRRPMITNVSLVTIYCLDQDKARDFYVDVLGFTPRTDVTMGEGFRWVTVGHPSQPELEITLMIARTAAGRRGRRLRPPAAGEGPAGRARAQRRRLPEDLRGAVGQGRGVPAGARPIAPTASRP